MGKKKNTCESAGEDMGYSLKNGYQGVRRGSRRVTTTSRLQCKRIAKHEAIGRKKRLARASPRGKNSRCKSIKLMGGDSVQRNPRLRGVNRLQGQLRHKAKLDEHAQPRVEENLGSHTDNKSAVVGFHTLEVRDWLLGSSS